QPARLAQRMLIVTRDRPVADRFLGVVPAQAPRAPLGRRQRRPPQPVARFVERSHEGELRQIREATTARHAGDVFKEDELAAVIGLTDLHVRIIRRRSPSATDAAALRASGCCSPRSARGGAGRGCANTHSTVAPRLSKQTNSSPLDTNVPTSFIVVSFVDSK